jgi:pimeloyl-ACP methyl ester carboxylesterase
LYGSGRPRPDVVGAYSIAHHVRDLEAILAAEGIRGAALVGWSMGVQVALEAYRMLPGLAENLVLLNGTFRRPLDTLSPVPAVAKVLPSLLELGRRAHAVAGQVTRRAMSQPEAGAWLKRMGLLAESLEDGVFDELAQAFSELDMEAYLKNLQALGEHDAEDVLHRIRVPALIITGDRDTLTPRALAESMARRIRAAELFVVRGGTHYTAVEYPELVSLRIQRFFRDHKF